MGNHGPSFLVGGGRLPTVGTGNKIQSNDLEFRPMTHKHLLLSFFDYFR